MTPRVRRATLAALAAAALLLVSCFEEPVDERLHLAFAAEGTLEVTLTQRLSLFHLDSDNPRLAARLTQEQRRLAEGWDGWPLRFDRATPGADSVTYRRFDGRLIEVERDASFDDPDAVGRFFSDLFTAGYRFDAESGAAELALYPAAASRAGGGERQRVERRLDAWAAELADYLAAVDRLYRHLEAHPGRDRVLFTRLFSAAGADEVVLDEGEGELVAAVDAGIEAVSSVLVVPDDDAWTWNELARRVYDPFPARLSVALPSAPAEVEGFVEREGEWTVPQLDLWGAFSSLAGRWVVPDPAAVEIEATKRAEPVELDAWLARPRSVEALPTPAEVRAALDAGLRPAGVYRLAWRGTPRPEERDHVEAADEEGGLESAP